MNRVRWLLDEKISPREDVIELEDLVESRK